MKACCEATLEQSKSLCEIIKIAKRTISTLESLIDVLDKEFCKESLETKGEK